MTLEPTGTQAAIRTYDTEFRRRAYFKADVAP